MNATNIDRYLKTGHTVRQIARFFDIPESIVQYRADRIAQRSAERNARRRVREQSPRPDVDALRRQSSAMQKWCELDIRFENDPRDPPFNYGAAIRNTVALRRQSHTGGGISSIYDSERPFDFHASRKAA